MSSSIIVTRLFFHCQQNNADTKTKELTVWQRSGSRQCDTPSPGPGFSARRGAVWPRGKAPRLSGPPQPRNWVGSRNLILARWLLPGSPRSLWFLGLIKEGVVLKLKRQGPSARGSPLCSEDLSEALFPNPCMTAASGQSLRPSRWPSLST